MHSLNDFGISPKISNRFFAYISLVNEYHAAWLLGVFVLIRFVLRIFVPLLKAWLLSKEPTSDPGITY